MITGRTLLYGIIADPILYIKTPQMMNALFAEVGHDGVMVPMHVLDADLETFVEGIRKIENLGGLIVTLPHKTRLLALCDRIEGDAQEIGAVNTIRREADGTLVGVALDGKGFIGGLGESNISVKGLDACLLGAGGAGSAVAFALAEQGVARLTIHNRSQGKAKDLAARVAARYPDIPVDVGAADTAKRDLIVNATSLGMKPEDAMPLGDLAFHEGQIVAEAIMSPEMTPLLIAAKAAGARIQPGAPMLRNQLRLMLDHMSAGRKKPEDKADGHADQRT